MKSIVLETYYVVVSEESLYKHQLVSNKSEPSDVPPISLTTCMSIVNNHTMFLSESSYQKAQTISLTFKASSLVRTLPLKDIHKIRCNVD